MTGSVNLVGFGLAVLGVGIGVGLVFMAAISGIARQPAAEGQIRPLAIIGFASIEALAMLCLVLVFAAPS